MAHCNRPVTASARQGVTIGTPVPRLRHGLLPTVVPSRLLERAARAHHPCCRLLEADRGNDRSRGCRSALDGLFAVIDDASRASAADIQAHYDPEFGFPQSIDIDYYANAVDDVLGLYVTGFRAL